MCSGLSWQIDIYPISCIKNLSDMSREKKHWRPFFSFFVRCRGKQMRRRAKGKNLRYTSIPQNDHLGYLGVSTNRGTPKWIGFTMENPLINGWFCRKGNMKKHHHLEVHCFRSRGPDLTDAGCDMCPLIYPTNRRLDRPNRFLSRLSQFFQASLSGSS